MSGSPEVASAIFFFRIEDGMKVPCILELDRDNVFIREFSIPERAEPYEVPEIPSTPLGLGDVMESGLKPIARQIDHYFGTDFENCVGCKKRAHGMNEFGEVTGINAIIRKMAE